MYKISIIIYIPMHNFNSKELNIKILEAFCFLKSKENMKHAVLVILMLLFPKYGKALFVLTKQFN